MAYAAYDNIPLINFIANAVYTAVRAGGHAGADDEEEQRNALVRKLKGTPVVCPISSFAAMVEFKAAGFLIPYGLLELAIDAYEPGKLRASGLTAADFENAGDFKEDLRELIAYLWTSGKCRVHQNNNIDCDCNCPNIYAAECLAAEGL